MGGPLGGVAQQLFQGIGGLMGSDDVVPFAVERIALDTDLAQFGVGYLDPGGVLAFVKLAAHLQPACGRRVAIRFTMTS